MTTLAPAAAPARFWRDAPAFAGLALFVALTALPLVVALPLDPRAFGGEAIWLKPLKFHAALVIYLATLALYARFMPAAAREGRGWGRFTWVVCAAVVAELLWIDGAAALGVASHFNTVGLWKAVYPVMGVLAITLTAASLWMGLAIRRNGALDPALRLSLVLGLVLTFVLTVIAAMTMAQHPGHYIGTPVTGARLPVMGWSREVGDMRVAHFLATHALHALPPVGWLMRGRASGRLVVGLAAVAYTALVAATYVQALAGDPLI